MPTQLFTLTVDGADLQSEPFIDALFEGGCDDATVGRVGGVSTSTSTGKRRASARQSCPR